MRSIRRISTCERVAVAMGDDDASIQTKFPCVSQETAPNRRTRSFFALSLSLPTLADVATEWQDAA